MAGMARRRTPELPELRPTGRTYVDRTRGGWLQGPGIEHHAFRRRHLGWVLFAAALLAAAWLAWRLT